MITDDLLSSFGDLPSVQDQDPNLWIPNAEEAQRDASAFLPRIIATIIDGAENRDWNR